MKITKSNGYFLFHIGGLTIDIPLSECEQRYKKFWFFCLLNIPFTSKILIFEFFKNFRCRFYVFDRKRKTKK